MSAVFNDDMEFVADTSLAGPSSVCMLSCAASVPCRSSGECVCSVLSGCAMLMMLLPNGVDNDAGIIVINCSGSVSVALFVGEFVNLSKILSIFLLVLAGLWRCLFAGVFIKMPGSVEVKIVKGLPWEESDARFINSTDLLLCSLVVSSWMRDEFNLSRVVSFLPFPICFVPAPPLLSVAQILCLSLWCVSSGLLLSFCRLWLYLWLWVFWWFEPLCTWAGSGLVQIGWWSRFRVGWWLFVGFACSSSFLLTEIVLFSFTDLHATKFISLVFDSLTMTRSFFLITVFLRLFVSSVIVVGE